jgi:hypothetical protein
MSSNVTATVTPYPKVNPLRVAELVPAAPAVNSMVMSFSGGAYTRTSVVTAPLTVVRASPFKCSRPMTVPVFGMELVPDTVTVGAEFPRTETLAAIDRVPVYPNPAGTVIRVPVVFLELQMI